LRLMGRFREEARNPRHWAMDEASRSRPHEYSTPAPNPAIVEQSREEVLVNCVPGLRAGADRAIVGGLIDSTPDSVGDRAGEGGAWGSS